jgi:hypothetical protein
LVAAGGRAEEYLRITMDRCFNPEVQMDRVLLELLRRLEAIGEQYEELFDSEVREAMDAAVWSGFIAPVPGYVLPDKFGMYSEEADDLVRRALSGFLDAATEASRIHGLDTFHKRLAAFQNHDIRTTQQNDFNDFFGWANPAEFDKDGRFFGSARKGD